MGVDKDPVRIILKFGFYLLLVFVCAWLFSPALAWVGGYFAGFTISGFLTAVCANALAMRVYERRGLLDIGLRWNRRATRNLALGLAGGIGAACLVVAGPLLATAARMRRAPDNPADWRTLLFVGLILLVGSAGEEMLYRGYGFQILLKAVGPYATILPTGILFGALHAANPNASLLGILNTAGFGILFGYAFLRSGDLWLPIGMHFGWNFTLPIFGVNVSGLTMRLTGYEVEWKAGPLWSGGEYGSEASILTSAVLIGLFFFIRRAPVRPQIALLLVPREN